MTQRPSPPRPGRRPSDVEPPFLPVQAATTTERPGRRGLRVFILFGGLSTPRSTSAWPCDLPGRSAFTGAATRPELLRPASAVACLRGAAVGDPPADRPELPEQTLAVACGKDRLSATRASHTFMALSDRVFSSCHFPHGGWRGVCCAPGTVLASLVCRGELARGHALRLRLCLD